MSDMTCLAEGLVVPADFAKTGLNLNEIVVGPTGCGKSYSNGYSRLVHTTDSSVVVPISKRAIREKFSDMFRRRGYEVVNLDFSHPELCEIGYDPMDYIRRDEDIIQLARNFIGDLPSGGRTGNVDPYWNDSGTSIVAAEIGAVRLLARDEGRKPCFADVIQLHRSLIYDKEESHFAANLDSVFEKLSVKHPGNQASELWKTIQGLSNKTASCILSIVNNAYDKIFSDSILEMTRKENRVKLGDLGRKKMAVFITTSPMNKTLQNYVNILYADLFRSLFETAEANENYRLEVPVHILCDDFACGSRIPSFEDYISIFRAAGISVTILLQSESQLVSMYGEAAATTIINNSDTYIYMGGTDIQTCRNVSLRMNKQLHHVMTMPLEQVVVFRRGHEPYMARRYQILSDPVYQQEIERSGTKEH